MNRPTELIPIENELTIEAEDKKLFRIAAKKMFLTYSQVNPDMTLQDLLEILQKKPFLGAFDYLIAKESHAEEGTHFHAILIRNNNKKFNIVCQNALDIEYEAQIYHGNYQSVKYLEHTIMYTCKDRQYITNIANLQYGKLLDQKDFFFERVHDVGHAQAIVEYSEKHPKKAFSGTSVSSLKKNYKDVEQLQYILCQDNIKSFVGMENFSLKGELKKWVEDPELYGKKSLVIVGRSGAGKTAFAIAFCENKGLKPLVISHREDLQRLAPSHDALIIDDADLTLFHPTEILALVETNVPKTIKVMWRAVRKKAGIVVIILMNHPQFKELSNIFRQEAIARRVVITEVVPPFMINVNINIHNGDINNTQNNFFLHQENEKKLVKDNRERIDKILKNNVF